MEDELSNVRAGEQELGAVADELVHETSIIPNFRG